MDIVQLTSGVVLGTCLNDDQADQDSNTPIKGNIVAVYVEPVIACASSPTITITTKNRPLTILEVATEISDWYFPRTPTHLNTTGAPISNVYSLGVPVYDFVNVEISDGQAGDYVNVYLLLE